MSKTDDEVVIDAAFFENILETDLANIVKKASSGQPLNKREREMIEEERTRRQKSPTHTSFALEGEGAANSLDKLTQRELAELWGYSLRQVKNWIHDGRVANDPAPVTNPDKMPAWFQRIYAPRECPEKLRLAAQRLLESKATVGSKPSTVAHPPVRMEVPDAEKGLLAMLDRYRTAEVTLHTKYMAAVDAGDETRASFLMSEWKKMGESVRGLEKNAPKALEEARIYVRRDEIQRELEPLHAAILKAFRQGFRSARAKLKSADGADAWGQSVDAVVDDIARMLVETEFREPLELEAA
jgi:hypothetical protein